MRIKAVDEAFESCERHLAETRSQGTEIESYLTRALVVLTVAAFEEKIEHLIEDRASRLEDGAMKAFVVSCLDAVFRSTRSTEIAGLLNRFGPEFKESFNRRADCDPLAVTFYNNIVANRHATAHTQAVNCTLGELKSFYMKGHIVIDCFAEALNETVSSASRRDP